MELEVIEHLQQCSCNCNHMGYGNVIDYQQTVLQDLPDLTEIHCNGIPERSNPADVTRLSPDATEIHRPKKTESNFKRRCICIVFCVLTVLVASGVGVPFSLGIVPGARSSTQNRLEIIHKLLKDNPLIDGHNDLPWNLRRYGHGSIAGVNLSSSIASIDPWATSPWSQTDIPRLRKGLLGAQFWSAYVPCGAQGLDAVQIVLEQIDLIRRLSELHPRHLSLVTSTKGILQAYKSGKIASLIGVEGGHAIDGSLSVLRALHMLGARYLTVTHSCDTSWAGAEDSERGLSDFGREVIREMNRLGIMVDLSHASYTTARDVLNVTRAPVIFSHSSAKALCNATRNVPDDILTLLKDNGGLVMISFYSLHIACGRSASIGDVVEHIKHVRKIAGIRHIGLGAGYDGIDVTPRGLEDVSRYPHLLAELLEDPTWTEEDVALIAGGNLLRVLSENEKLTEQWRLAAVPPTEYIDNTIISQCSRSMTKS
uniref:Dipeptidase n=1 Tax=Xenopsylla cheopis TaxID=163159 RepID=A0A6M2DHR6_XENCH